MHCKFVVVEAKRTQAFSVEADAWIPAVRLVLESAAHPDRICGRSGDPNRTLASGAQDPSAEGLPGPDPDGHYKPCVLQPGHKGKCSLKGGKRTAHAEAEDPLFHTSTPKGLVDVLVTKPENVLEAQRLSAGQVVVVDLSWSLGA